MQYLVFEFGSEKELKEVTARLQGDYKVTGELAARPLPGGRWRLEITSEKELREVSLEKFKEYRVEIGDD